MIVQSVHSFNQIVDLTAFEKLQTFQWLPKSKVAETFPFELVSGWPKLSFYQEIVYGLAQSFFRTTSCKMNVDLGFLRAGVNFKVELNDGLFYPMFSRGSRTSLTFSWSNTRL